MMRFVIDGITASITGDKIEGESSTKRYWRFADVVQKIGRNLLRGCDVKSRIVKKTLVRRRKLWIFKIMTLRVINKRVLNSIGEPYVRYNKYGRSKTKEKLTKPIVNKSIYNSHLTVL
jgi:hypothetical protein